MRSRTNPARCTCELGVRCVTVTRCALTAAVEAEAEAWRSEVASWQEHCGDEAREHGHTTAQRDRLARDRKALRWTLKMITQWPLPKDVRRHVDEALAAIPETAPL